VFSPVVAETQLESKTNKNLHEPLVNSKPRQDKPAGRADIEKRRAPGGGGVLSNPAPAVFGNTLTSGSSPDKRCLANAAVSAPELGPKKWPPNAAVRGLIEGATGDRALGDVTDVRANVIEPRRARGESDGGGANDAPLPQPLFSTGNTTGECTLPVVCSENNDPDADDTGRAVLSAVVASAAPVGGCSSVDGQERCFAVESTRRRPGVNWISVPVDRLLANKIEERRRGADAEAEAAGLVVPAAISPVLGSSAADPSEEDESVVSDSRRIECTLAPGLVAGVVATANDKRRPGGIGSTASDASMLRAESIATRSGVFAVCGLDGIDDNALAEPKDRRRPDDGKPPAFFVDSRMAESLCTDSGSDTNDSGREGGTDWDTWRGTAVSGCSGS
jgi:hypothetical protein